VRAGTHPALGRGGGSSASCTSAIAETHTHDSSVLTCLCLPPVQARTHAVFASAACQWLCKIEGGTSSMDEHLASVVSRRTVTAPPARHARSTARGRNHAARHDRCVCRQRCRPASSLTAFRRAAASGSPTVTPPAGRRHWPVCAAAQVPALQLLQLRAGGRPRAAEAGALPVGGRGLHTSLGL
jgi:hypothetical protein